MMLVITSLRYPFFNKVFFIKPSSPASFGLEKIIKVFVELILYFEGKNEPHHMYDAVNVGLK